jgi:glycosyltransferase involved in cell wall biosynthesis
MAGPGVEFLGRCSGEEVRRCYRQAGVVLLPGEEDFGIVPVEAQACGRPVAALGRGGVLETVIDGVTGVLVPSASPEAFADAIRRALDAPFDTRSIRRHAETFGRQRFLETFRTAIEETMTAPAREASW